MFSERDLAGELAAVREAYAPGVIVLDCERDFQTLPPEHRDDLALLVESLTPSEYDTAWLPEDAPQILYRLASSDFVVGTPGDGAVAWTTQTDPPVVFVKARTEGTPEAFERFLVAEALVEAGLDLPEQFLGFFEDEYRAFDAAVDADPASVYQLASACCDAYRGLHAREEFESWADDYPDLHEAWVDAGERVTGRIDGLPKEIARGETSFSDAAELACSAVKHDVELPAPFAALDTLAYRRHGASYAVTWAEKVFDADAADSE
ncbi:uncharacterized protein HHUB_3765 [Halobacterium hubeiense]|uniref:Uncharacterized protein n=1 Tax=Halobacterium hubeiense TaxID=1407499 RepID=A0A0U5H6G7_9EURY|nr:hypothetical protein [Halobacterium hubeiense]CQH62448.1 uncharacterized protein HHUB_3765 [Halobacterium hubeiense]